MQADECLVKSLSSTETMGSATSICTDKTGTLTQNRMTVTKCALGNGTVESASTGQTCGQVLEPKAPKVFREILGMGIAVNKAEAEIKWNPAANRWDQIGNKTDCALLAFAYDLGYDYREINFDMASATKVYPFSSDRKRAGIVVPLPGGKFRIYLKGASEIILSLCGNIMDPASGSATVLTQDKKREIIDTVVTPFAKASLRTIALAYAEFDSAQDWERKLSDEEAVSLTGQSAETFATESGVTLVAMVGIEDPLRETVTPAIVKCNHAGVDVRMVTGDNIDTAIAISKQCGILRPVIDLDGEGNPLNKYVAMTGPDFRKKVLDPSGAINQANFDQVWPYLRVLARSSPTDKYNLVSGIIESNLFEDPEKVKSLQIYHDRQVVAVTGDGTNDAPALKRADVGFVMGITGTSVAKDAADIIITDDDFSSIVEACKWGRNVYDSISKFLQFQLTINVVAVSLVCLGSIATGAPPLSAVQMLWVNLIMDSLGALALASEPPVPELLERPPYGRNASLLSFHMKFNLLGQAFYQMVILASMLFAGAGPPGEGNVCDLSQIGGVTSMNGEVVSLTTNYSAGDLTCSNCGGFLDIPSGNERETSDDPSQHYTVIFNTFVMMQLFNWINCRKLYHEYNVFAGITDNRMFIGIWVLCFLMQCIIVEIGVLSVDSDVAACKGINRAFKAVHLNSSQWLLSLAIGMGAIPWQMVLIFLAKTFFPAAEKVGQAGGGHRTDPVPRRVSTQSEESAIRVGTTASGKLQTFTSGTSSISGGARQSHRVRAANQTLTRSGSRLSDKQKTIELFKASNPLAVPPTSLNDVTVETS